MTPVGAVSNHTASAHSGRLFRHPQDADLKVVGTRRRAVHILKQ